MARTITFFGCVPVTMNPPMSTLSPVSTRRRVEMLARTVGSRSKSTFQPADGARIAPASSTTYRRQAPFGFVPLKTESAEVPAGAGAGAGNVSPGRCWSA